MYVTLISATVLYLNASSHYQPGPSIQRLIKMGTPLLILLAIELFVFRQHDMNSPKRLAAALLLARMVLLEIVSSLDGSGVSLFLYPLVPFSAAFSFGLRLSQPGNAPVTAARGRCLRPENRPRYHLHRT